MNIITAINNEKIFNELKNNEKIKIISNDIQYKEGILEILEKNKNINYIIFYENLNGQIKIEELINKIKKINNKIKIIIILDKKDFIKEEYLIKNKIKFILKENLSAKKILEIIFNKNKVFAINGSRGSGKTTTTLILCELLNKYKNKKILIVEDDIKNNCILKTYKLKNDKKSENTEENVIKIKDKIYLLNIKSLLINNRKNKTKIISIINKIKKQYDYVIIDFQNLNSIKIYEEIIDENILVLNSNVLEINKIKKYIINNKKEIKIILNNYNENSISEKILKNIFNNKIKIIGKIENNKFYNLIINNNFNLKFLSDKIKNEYFKIIKNI